MDTRPRRVRLTREELYEQVWTTPMRRLAPTYGLSDVGLRKVCIAHNIPTPGVGYWAKKAAGKRVKRPPLPALVNEPQGLIHLEYNPDPRPRVPNPPGHPASDPDLVALVLFERDPKNRIVVPDRLHHPHEIIQKTREVVGDKPKMDPCDRYPRIRLRSPDADECSDISVGQESLPRAFRLMDRLFRELEKRGHRVVILPVPPGPAGGGVNRVRCMMLDEEFGFLLREIGRIIPLPIEQQSRYRLGGARVRYEMSGRFELTVRKWCGCSGTATWKDEGTHRVEDQLNEVIVGMVGMVQEHRRWLAESESRERARLQREQERIEAERLRVEAERLRRLERDRIQRLELLTVQWQKAESMRAFVRAVEAEATHRSGEIDPDGGLARWLRWTTDHIRTIDPLAGPKLPEIEAKDLKATD